MASSNPFTASRTRRRTAKQAPVTQATALGLEGFCRRNLSNGNIRCNRNLRQISSLSLGASPHEASTCPSASFSFGPTMPTFTCVFKNSTIAFTESGRNTTSGLRATTIALCETATPRFTARPKPRFFPVWIMRTRSPYVSNAPRLLSDDALSTTTTSRSISRWLNNAAMHCARFSPAFQLTTIAVTRSGIIFPFCYQPRKKSQKCRMNKDQTIGKKGCICHAIDEECSVDGNKCRAKQTHAGIRTLLEQ